MHRSFLLLAATAFAVAPAVAQLRSMPPMSSGNVLPKDRTAPKVTRLDRTMILPSLPASMVQLETATNWSISRAAPADSPSYALYVERHGRPPAGQFCSRFTDRVDLRPVRAHGYKLTNVIVTASLPDGISAGGAGNYRITGLDSAGSPLPQGSPVASYEQISIAVITRRDPANPSGLVTCVDVYGLKLTVNGKASVDPITGGPAS